MTVAVVTGASSGIGKAIYEYLLDSNKFGLERVVGVSRSGPDLAVDLERWVERPWEDMIQHVRCLGPVSLLVNAAGKWGEETGTDHTIMQLNFWSPKLLTDRLIRDLLFTGGCVINIASTSGTMPEPDNPIYAASKAALISLTKSYAIKYAPKARFVSISPGFIRTNFFPSPAPQHLVDTIPLGYEAQPSDLLPLVDAVIQSKYITGVDLIIDGGKSCKGI